MFPVETVFFIHSAWFPWGSSKLLYVSVVISFLLLSTTPWYGCTKVHLTIHSLKEIWVVTSFQTLKTKLLWTSMYKFLCENNFLFLWDKSPRVQVMG